MNEESTSRRAMLRGTFAVGCGLVLPVSLFGCDSKPAPNTPVATPVVPPIAPPAAPPAAPPPTTQETTPAAAEIQKVAQASVQYQGQPKGDLKCGDCSYFLAESNTCQRVEGQISPDGWCLLWLKKA
ncbi:MAG: hypothetical protein Q8M20_08095 [Rhodocyclaceae bacterium]|nr:hypothetical protein [Rhodocyclaceae bacterium]MDZ4216431.1 hypothetical protein [Rhodocyclaceae bacterium]